MLMKDVLSLFLEQEVVFININSKNYVIKQSLTIVSILFILIIVSNSESIDLIIF